MTTPIPNPWIPQSEADNSRALDTGAASPARSSAAPVPIQSSDERTDEAKAREVSIMEWEAAAAVHAPHTERQTGVGSERSSSSETNHINEIFWFVRNKLQDYPRFVLDEKAFMADVEPLPLFLRQRAAE